MKISTIFCNSIGIALFVLGAYYTLTSSLVYMLIIGLLIMTIGGALLPIGKKITFRDICWNVFVTAFLGIAHYIMFIILKNFAPGVLEIFANMLFTEIATIENMMSLPPNSFTLGAVIWAAIFDVASNIIISRKR